MRRTTGAYQRLGWIPPTLEECVRSCVANAEEAARKERIARDRYRDLPPGDSGLVPAMCEASKYAAEQMHWRGLAQWHREQLSARVPLREPGDDGEEAAE